MSRHVAVGGAEDDEQRVVALDPEEVCPAADLEVSAAGEHCHHAGAAVRAGRRQPDEADLEEDEGGHLHRLARLALAHQPREPVLQVPAQPPLPQRGVGVPGHRLTLIQKSCSPLPVGHVLHLLLEDDVHLPGLDEDGGEHDGGAEAAEELQEAAGAGAEPRVEEEDTGE